MKAYCLLNHELTENQIKELAEKYDCSKIIYPDENLTSAWSQIPTTVKPNKMIITKVTDWLKSAVEFDVLIIQGEYGSTFTLVDYALKNRLIPLYAVTKRTVEETRVGETVTRNAIFQHVCFREYEYFK